MLIRSKLSCLTNPPEFSAHSINSIPAKSPKPREIPKLICFQDTPRKRENRSKKKMRPTCTMRTESCRVVMAFIIGCWSEELENATTTETSSITTPDHCPYQRSQRREHLFAEVRQPDAGARPGIRDSARGQADTRSHRQPDECVSPAMPWPLQCDAPDVLPGEHLLAGRRVDRQ